MTHSLLPRHAAIVGVAVAFEPAVGARRQAPTAAGAARPTTPPAAIWPPGMPAPSATPPPRRPITSTCSSPIRTMPICSAAPSSRCSPTATSMRPASLPTGCSQVDHTDRIARLVLGVRALKQKQYGAGAAELRAVGARPGDRSDRDAAVGLGARRRRRYARRDRHDRQAVGPGLVLRSSRICMPASSSISPTTRRTPASATSAPTRPTRRRCARCEAYGRYLSRNGSKDDALKVYQDFDKALPDHPLIDRRDEGRSPTARSCRRWSIRRRPAPPRRSTGSAPRSAAAAARIWR